MNKILITGGAGFVGLALAKRLAATCQVDLLDNFSRGKNDSNFIELLNHKNINFIKHDLKNPLKIKKNYDFIFHLAAIIGVNNVILKPYSVLTENYVYLENVLKFSKTQKILKKLFFFSTSEVYAGSISSKLIKFPTPETQLLALPLLDDKRSTYLLSKIYGESLCIHSGLPVVLIRPHNIYGPRMGTDHVIPQLANKIFNKNKITVFNPKHKRTFCYIEDFIDALILLMNKKKLRFNVYNIGNPCEEITIINLAKKIINYNKKNKKIYVKNLKNSSPIRRIPNIKRLVSETGFRNKITLNRGLIKTLDWYKKYF